MIIQIQTTMQATTNENPTVDMPYYVYIWLDVHTSLSRFQSLIYLLKSFLLGFMQMIIYKLKTRNITEKKSVIYLPLCIMFVKYCHNCE